MAMDRDDLIALLTREVVARAVTFFDPPTDEDGPEDPAQDWVKGTTELRVSDDTRRFALGLAVTLHIEVPDYDRYTQQGVPGPVPNRASDEAILATAEAFRGWLTADE